MTVVDRSAEALRRLAAQMPGLRTIFSTRMRSSTSCAAPTW